MVYILHPSYPRSANMIRAGIFSASRVRVAWLVSKQVLPDVRARYHAERMRTQTLTVDASTLFSFVLRLLLAAACVPRVHLPPAVPCPSQLGCSLS
jgi:hypothetical protein